MAARGCGSKLFALLTALLAGPAAALDPGLAVTQYSQRAWRADGTEGSLPQNSVFSILQTRDGYLWLATQEGLARFDGVRFTMFNTKTTEAIRHNDVWTLLEDRDGSLWIGTRGGGLTHFKDGTFSHLGKEQGLSNEAIQALWQAPDGALWIGTRGGGLNQYKDGKFKVFTTKDGLSSDTVYSLSGDARGMWIGTDGGGLDRYEGGTFTALTTKQGLSFDTVYAVLRDRAGDLWIGTGAGLDRLRDGKIEIFRVAQGLSNDNIRSLREDRAGNLWIGTDGGGLNRYAGGKFTALTTKQGLSNDNVGAIYEDREGALWVGTDAGGLNRLTTNKFVSYGALQGLSNENARAIIQDRDDSLWIGTFGGLNHYANGRVTTITTQQGLSSDVVLSLSLGYDGAIWAGTLGAGLNRIDHGKVTRYGKAQGLSNDTVLGLLEDSHGTLWVGTRSGGLNVLQKNGRFRAYTTADGLGSNDVRYIREARAGGLWIGTLGGGLNRFVDGTFKAYTTKDGLSSDLVFSIHEDAAGVLWIGTFGGGLNRYKDGKFSAFRAKDGLLDDVVYQILEDDSGNLWISTNHGVARLSKKELDDFADGKVTAVHPAAFGLAEGLRSVECNGAHQPAGWKTRDGKLWFPTIAGVSATDPKHQPLNTLPPPVVIEAFRVNDKPAPLGAEAELEPGRASLDFQFTALSMLAPERVRFRYRLQGYDEDWIDAGSQRSARYTNLPPGHYTFQVKAANNDGVWNEGGAAQAFYLRPHFWQRPAFYLVYVLALGVAVALGMRLGRERVRRLQERQRELMRLMRERQLAVDTLTSANETLEERIAQLKRAQAEREGISAFGIGHTVQPGDGVPHVDKLVADFNTAMGQLVQRERELQQAQDALAQEVGEKTRANTELKQTLLLLKATQAQLVQSEKLASLGSLVAGIAREINAPLSVSANAAARLNERSKMLSTQRVGGRLPDHELDDFIAVALDSTQVQLANLHRATELIRSFKQVAVDQSSGERRRFDLRAYIEEVLLSHTPRLTEAGHSVIVECPQHLMVDTYPGALAQLLGHFIANALSHAFPTGVRGKVTISAVPEPGGVALRFADNGVGIPAENLKKIFDPFFTTKRGVGGSGLGLHIVHNIVTQLLGGTIHVTSAFGQGALFEVRFPATAPHRE